MKKKPNQTRGGIRRNHQGGVLSFIFFFLFPPSLLAVHATIHASAFPAASNVSAVALLELGLRGEVQSSYTRVYRLGVRLQLLSCAFLAVSSARWPLVFFFFSLCATSNSISQCCRYEAQQHDAQASIVPNMIPIML